MSRDALVVGINTYSYEGLDNLKAPAKDAEAIAQLLEEYGDFTVTRLPAVKDQENNKPKLGQTKKVNLTKLEKSIVQLFKPEGKPPDTALLYFSGHGLRKNQGIQEGFLASSDVNPDIGNWGVRLKWLRELLQESEVKQQIIILDCCYSGELLNFTEADPGDRGKGRDRCFIAASRSFEVAYEEIDNQHSVFTAALLKGLEPLQERWVTNYTLADKLNQEHHLFPQRPIFGNSGETIDLTRRWTKATQKSTTPSTAICPYKGLRYFDCTPEDASFFYGRNTLTDELLEKVRVANFLAVLGASGSGKSSVVRAGLLYQLKLGRRLSGSENWLIKIFKPGERPLQSLALAFLDTELSGVERASQLAKAEELIAKGADGLRQLVTSLVIDDTQRLVLVVDQFEEAFALCKDNEERQRFFECLLGALQQFGDKLCLVLTMRSDFFGKCTEQEYSGLAQQIQENLVTVTPMTREELKKAIVEPANFVELKIEPELVEEMLADVANAPGTLPLLQDTLTELWKNHSDNCLRLNTYAQLGGVMGTLHQRATKVYESFDKEEQAVCKHIFLALTQLGEGTEDTRRRCFKQDLVNKRYSEELIDKVVQRLADEKLIITDEIVAKGGASEKVAVVDVAHEALIRYWTLLRRWIDENRDKLRQKRKIEAAAEEWRDKEKSKDYLLTRKQSRDAKAFQKEEAENLTLSNLSYEFIEKSVRYRRNDRLRLFGCVFSPMLLLSPFLTIFLVSIFLVYVGDREVKISHLRDVVRQAKGQKVNNERFHALQKLVSLDVSLEQIDLEDADLKSANLEDADLKSANLEDADLKSADLKSANLRSANLRSANLRSANLTSADLSSANLKDAKLISANLINANLTSADLSSANLKDAKLSGTNLRSANLENADLSGANLENANLRDADLSGANLSGTNLSHADLRNTNLTIVNLSSTKLNNSLYNKQTKFPKNFSLKNQKMYLIAPGANLRSADLRYTDFKSVNLSGAKLSGTNLSGANLENADLSSADLSSANLKDANLKYTDLRNTNLRSANLKDADLGLTDLRSANLSSANLEDANLSSADLSSANLKDANLKDADLGSADLRNTNLSSANLKQADFGYADLSGADLSGADLRSADLSDANLSGTKLNNSLYNKQTKFPENFNPKNQRMYLIAPEVNLKSANFTNADLSNANLRGANLKSINLRGADLSGADLSGADLSSANLKSINLRGADLSGTNLRDTNLSGADLGNTNLTNVNLSGTQLKTATYNKQTKFPKNFSPKNQKMYLIAPGVNLSGANLSDANLVYVNLTSANLSGTNLMIADLRNANLSDANLSGANLENADLSSADLSGANLRNADFNGTKLFFANLRSANLNGANLNGTNLMVANLSGTNLSSANLNGANLNGANLRSANLNDANLKSANLNGANLSSTNLSGTNLSGTNFGGTKPMFVELVSAYHNYGEWLGALFYPREAENITPAQIKQAKNWEKAIYSPEFRKKLGLPPAYE